MKSISFIAFILSIFSNLHVAAQDQIFVEKFVPKETYRGRAIVLSDARMELLKKKIQIFSEGNKIVEKMAYVKLESALQDGIEVLSYEEYQKIDTKIKGMQSDLKNNPDPATAAKLEAEIKNLSKNYTSTYLIVKELLER